MGRFQGGLVQISWLPITISRWSDENSWNFSRWTLGRDQKRRRRHPVISLSVKRRRVGVLRITMTPCLTQNKRAENYSELWALKSLRINEFRRYFIGERSRTYTGGQEEEGGRFTLLCWKQIYQDAIWENAALVYFPLPEKKQCGHSCGWKECSC